MTGPREEPTGGRPRPTTPPAGAVQGGMRPTPPQGGARQARPSGQARRQPPSSPRRTRIPWLIRERTRLRAATWIGVVLIAIRLIAPRPDGWRRWNDAGAALADVDAARTAALVAYQAAGRQWPAPGRLGQVPHALLPYFPGDHSFSSARYHLAWEYAADTASGVRLIGISVVGDDPRLALTMAKRAPEGMSFVVSGGRFIALIASALGR